MALSEAAGFVHHDVALSTGVSLHVSERSGAGTPVILLHGIWGSWQSWLPVIDLPIDPFGGRPLVFLDLRGHGESDKPQYGYDLSDYAADLRAVIEQRAEPRVILVGHSLGALTSLAAAKLVPDCIEALILEEPPLPLPTDVRFLAGFWEKFAEAVVGLFLLKHEPLEIIVETLMDHDPELARSEAEEDAALIANTADGVFTAIINGDFQADHLTDPGIPLIMPSLIFQGSEPDQRALSDEGVAQLRRLLPDSPVVSLPETGHSVHSADPAGFSHAVEAFLRANAR